MSDTPTDLNGLSNDQLKAFLHDVIVTLQVAATGHPLEQVLLSLTEAGLDRAIDAGALALVRQKVLALLAKVKGK